MIADMPWRAEAACRDADPALFFPVESQRRAGEIRRVPPEAKAICRRCPVQAECLRWALEHQEEGVWGGTSTDERRQMRKPDRGTKRTLTHGASGYRRGCRCEYCTKGFAAYRRTYEHGRRERAAG